MFSTKTCCYHANATVVHVMPLRAQTFGSLYLETSFLYARTSSEYLGQVRMSWSSGQGQGHISKKRDKRA